MAPYLKISRAIIYILLVCALSLPIVSGISAEFRPNISGPSSSPFSAYIPLIASPNFSIFGASLSPHNSTGEIQKVAMAGSVWTRIGLDWRLIEPSYGNFDWSQARSVEQALVAINQEGLQPILILDSTPVWALKPIFSCGAILQDFFPEFAKFAKEVVKRYSVPPYNVKYFEIYNEPDAAGILGCWGDPGDIPYYGGVYYGQFLQTVYPAIKSVNPNAQVLVGGLLMDCDPDNPPIIMSTGQRKDCMSTRFFDGILISGAGNSFDGVSFHSYDYYAGPGQYNNINWNSSRTLNGSSSLQKAAYLRNTMQKYGVAEKPLFDTEYALFCGDEYFNTCSGFQGELEATKAYYVVQFMTNAMADNYKAAVWYKTMGGGRNVSILKPDLTPLPVYNAYKFTNQQIGNTQYSQQISDPDFVIHEFKKANAKIWIVWTKDNLTHTLTLPTLPSGIYRIGTDGNPISDPPTDAITLDMAPAIIVFAQ